jgi:hypothetical protein
MIGCGAADGSREGRGMINAEIAEIAEEFISLALCDLSDPGGVERLRALPPLRSRHGELDDCTW